MPDELEIIDSIVKVAGKVPRGYARIGDDVAVIPLGNGKLVVKADMLVEHTDVPPGMTYRQAARKSVAMCVSDFAAKGVRPDSFMASIGVVKGITEEKVEELARGFLDAKQDWRLNLVGGDTNETQELVIDCVMAGFAKRLVGRKGARPGDSLVVTGDFGYPPSGMRILMDGAEAGASFARKAVQSVVKPTPNLELGIALAPYLSSSMDSSDGLSRSIHTLAKESGVGFELNRLPTDEGVEAFAKKNGFDEESLVLQGGEEYLMVGTVSKRKIRAAAGAARRNGGQLIEIGEAISDRDRVELHLGSSRRPLIDQGWTHLSAR